MDTMPMVLMTIEHPDAAPALSRAAEILGVPLSAMDVDFGVVPIDPELNLYSVQVCDSVLEGGNATGTWPNSFSGPSD
jgi:hypothetical protein